MKIKKEGENSKSLFSKYASKEYRWYALIFIALGLGIVIIDNTVLNVSIPYILRDLNTSFSTIEWAISGYALMIAAVLITAGRLGEMLGYRKMFATGVFIFMAGSFIASEAHSAIILIVGRALIQALGAAIVLTSALALLTSNFEGKERAIAFGVWGSVAGAAATIGPLLGGYLTADFSWRWSLRINIIVGLVVLAGSILIQESASKSKGRFDWYGMLLSSLGLFSLVFGIIEGRKYGWVISKGNLPFWNFNISIVPFIFAIALISLTAFVFYEKNFEKKGKKPLLHMELFKNRGFSIGLLLLVILTLGMYGVIFVIPIYFENVLNLNALQTGVGLISMSLSVLIMGLSSGFLASKMRIKYIVVIGLFILCLGDIYLMYSISITSTRISLAPALILFGLGFGLGSSQLNNLIISSAPKKVAGESSATSSTMRQVGSAIGIALIGTILATSLASELPKNINADPSIPAQSKAEIITSLSHVNIESGRLDTQGINTSLISTVKKDVDSAVVYAAKRAVMISLVFVALAFLLSLFLPKKITEERLSD